jgi:hypothetical protein
MIRTKNELSTSPEEKQGDWNRTGMERLDMVASKGMHKYVTIFHGESFSHWGRMQYIITRNWTFQSVKKPFTSLYNNSERG